MQSARYLVVRNQHSSSATWLSTVAAKPDEASPAAEALAFPAGREQHRAAAPDQAAVAEVVERAIGEPASLEESFTVGLFERDCSPDDHETGCLLGPAARSIGLPTSLPSLRSAV